MKFYVTSKISDNIHETPEGYLVCVGVPIARTGEMVYAKGETPLEAGDDGRVLIIREEAEVFRPETIASFEGKALTVSHPDQFVGPENWNDLAVGIIQNVRRGKDDQDQDLIADLLVTSAMAIGLVKNGLREVSCGYEADYVQTGKGRGTQRKIVGNHLALVDQGRAGSSYAINDHKPKGERTMKAVDKIKAIFAKAQDEAIKAATTDEGAPNPSDPKPKEEKASDAMGMDEMMNMIKDLGSKMDKLMPKDASSPPDTTTGAPAKQEAADEPVNSGLEDRLKALEASVAKLLERESKEDEVPVDDEDMDEEETDDEEMEGEMVGDTASRIEILAPGMKATAKDAKAKALLAAYATKDGKEAIDMLTGGKAPDFKNSKVTDAVFIAASELLKNSREGNLAATKMTTQQTRDFHSQMGTPKGAMTPEQVNDLNAKHYAQKA